MTKKESITRAEGSTPQTKESEFTVLLSRGKLSHPSANVYELSLYLYTFFKLREVKCCNNIFLQAFHQIYELTHFEIDGNINSILRRFANCFFCAFSRTYNEKKKHEACQIKRRRISSR